MYKKLIQKLLSIAKSKGYTVQFEPYGRGNSAEIYRQSKVLIEYKRILIYYNTELIKLAVLSHEIGHIETFFNGLVYSVNIPYYERKASQWALQFLKQGGFNRITEIKALLNKSLLNYGAKTL